MVFKNLQRVILRKKGVLYYQNNYLPEAWRKMHRHITVPLFKTVVFPYVMKIITTNNYCALHLHFLNNTSKNSSSDGHISSEWTFFVNVRSLDGLCVTFLNQYFSKHEIFI
jgi:hypothetical protein